MSKHTPGPWGWVYEDESMQTLCGTDPDYPDSGPEPLTQHVLSVSPCDACQKRTRDTGEFNKCLGPNEADAQLIKASPDLLKAARDAVEVVVSMWGEDSGGKTGAVRDRLQAAIAKATGDTE